MARLLHLPFNPVTCPGGDSNPDEGTDGTAKQGSDQLRPRSVAFPAEVAAPRSPGPSLARRRDTPSSVRRRTVGVSWREHPSLPPSRPPSRASPRR